MPTAAPEGAAPTAPRLLIVPGLHDSGPAHWQSWLEAQEPGARRVVQRDWQAPDLERWAARELRPQHAAIEEGLFAV
jgi:predicted alpha/beta hydrolase family esterase